MGEDGDPTGVGEEGGDGYIGGELERWTRQCGSGERGMVDGAEERV